MYSTPPGEKDKFLLVFLKVVAFEVRILPGIKTQRNADVNGHLLRICIVMYTYLRLSYSAKQSSLLEAAAARK
jgi:hypothetical protein